MYSFGVLTFLTNDFWGPPGSTCAGELLTMNTLLIFLLSFFPGSAARACGVHNGVAPHADKDDKDDAARPPGQDATFVQPRLGTRVRCGG